MVYSVFVYTFSKFLGRKNIIRLNLSQYNTQPDSSLKKFLAAVFYLLEYIIILPILVFFGFAILSFLFLLFSEDQPVSQILLVSAALVGAIRVVSYFRESLSRDLSKLFPFAVLAIFLLSPTTLKITSLIEKLAEIPSFLTQILHYLAFVICFESLIRGVYTIAFLCKRPEEQEQEEVEEAFKAQEED
ncbi:hypothetical protein A3K73_04180 [Candidatus Pacearchaeota archaeon RBG_13_36_9]|nr:MAG: hypothetical protein A3K73_04180 [Candidatus Pacearchaeota archaeon RBG_13_36_9]